MGCVVVPLQALCRDHCQEEVDFDPDLEVVILCRVHLQLQRTGYENCVLTA